MWKSLIKLRKNTWLPLKFFFERKKQAKGILYPPTIKLLNKADEIRDLLLKAERELDVEKIEYWKGSMAIIDWLVSYGDTDEKGNTS